MIIFNLMKGLYIAFNKGKKQLLWFMQFSSIKKLKYKSRASVYVEGSFKRILIVVPHADDELIGCYQLIKNYKEAVKLFYCGFSGSNPNSQNKAVRLGEFEAFCSDLGVKYTISSNKVEIDLEREIAEYSPDAIFLPSCVDWHDEHRRINYISAKVLEHIRLSTTIVWYQISVPFSSDWVSFLVPLSKRQLKEKWREFMKFYKTQAHMPIQRFKYVERVSGSRNGLFACEVFSIMQTEEWFNYLRLLQSLEFMSKMNSFSKDIDNLPQIYREADSIYKLFK